MSRWTFLLCLLYGFISGLTCLLCSADPLHGRRRTSHDDAYQVAWIVGLVAGLATLFSLVMSLKHMGRL